MIFERVFLLIYALRVAQAFTTGSPSVPHAGFHTTTTSLAAESDGITGVTLKIAFDAQGGVADLSAEKSERFTCGESLDMVHRLRRDSDAVLVGRSTVEIDDCTLTVRRVPTSRKQPVRVIVDPRRDLNLAEFKIFNDGLETIVIHASDAERADEKDVPFVKTTNKDYPGVAFLGFQTMDEEGKQRLCTRQICAVLASEFDIHHIMVEGGPNTALSFLKDGTVDRAILVTAPIEFKEPLQSNMSTSTLQEAGLEEIGEYALGVDSVKCFSRPNLPWPSSTDVSSWP